MATFQSLPGFREFYPEECAARNGLFQAWRDAARRFGFQEYDGPVLEPLELYLEKSGEEIRQQLFEFEDKGGRKVALRPEMTPTLARLVGARAGSLRKPVKWFTIAEMFRYEKPQKGRLRSHYQLNGDILGEAGPAADAECIALLVEALRSAGLKEGEFVVRLSDRKLWFLFLESLGLNTEQTVGALSIVDKWEREPKEEIKKKLAGIFADKAEAVWERISALLQAKDIAGLLGFFSSGLTGQSEALAARMVEWQQLLEKLYALGLEQFIRIDLGVVRGLAYYTGFVFEAFQTVGTARALAGGGRYDNLIQKLGGPEMPAVGFGMGDVTVTDLLQELKRMPGRLEGPEVYVVMGSGETERTAALELVGTLRAAGLSVDYPLKEAGFGKQFKAADQGGAKVAIVVGEDEVKSGQVKIQEMKTGAETMTANDGELAEKVRGMLADAAKKL